MYVFDEMLACIVNVPNGPKIFRVFNYSNQIFWSSALDLEETTTTARKKCIAYSVQISGKF